MKRKRLLYVIIGLVIVICLVGCAKPAPAPAPKPTPPAAAPAPEALPPISQQMGSGTEGSFGFACGILVCKLISDRVPAIDVTAIPTQGTTAATVLYCKGETDAAYSGTFTLYQLARQKGPFEGKTFERLPYHTWYYGDAPLMMVTKKDRTDINSYKDLVGKKVFPYRAGTGIYDMYKELLTELGYWERMEITQVDVKAVVDALELGTIDAVGAYGSCFGDLLSSWVKELDTRVELKFIPLTDEEVEKVDGMDGLAIEKLTPTGFKNNLGVEDILCPYDVKGWLWGPDTPAEYVYEVVKALHTYGERDFEGTPLLVWSSKNFETLQTMAIDAFPESPVHPGAAKYYKEIGLWKDYWKIGETQTLAK